MSVFRNLDCLSLVVCSNTTLLKLQTVLFLLFSKFCASKSGVRLIYGCGLYTDVYGISVLILIKLNENFLMYMQDVLGILRQHVLYENNVLSILLVAGKRCRPM